MHDRLLRDAAARAAHTLATTMSPLERTRLERLLALASPAGLIRLSDALTTLFPEHDRAGALTAFRQYRVRLRLAARDTTGLELRTDGQTRTAPEHRWCWFTATHLPDADAVPAPAEAPEPSLAEVAATLRLILDAQHQQMRMLHDMQHRLDRIERALGESAPGPRETDRNPPPWTGSAPTSSSSS